MADVQQNFQDELQKLTIGGLQELGKWIEGAKDFAVEQAPKFAQEFVKWHIVSHAVYFLACLAFIVVVLWTGNKTRKILLAWNKRLSPGDQGFGTFIAVVVTVAAFILFLIAGERAFDHAASVGKGVFAPRLVIVDGIKDIVTNNTQQTCKK